MTNKDEIKTGITPQTLVGDFLKNYPELEEKLIEIAPVFKKLRNPVLRRTVAKVTTLRQAAVVGGVELSKLINELRKAAGLDAVNIDDSSQPGQQEKPAWVSENRVVKEYDARPDLEIGNHPAARVTKEVLELAENESYLLITPFIPAPLVKILKEKGYSVYSEKKSETEVLTYISE